jgi:DNA-binding SARP family transcriptional activator
MIRTLRQLAVKAIRGRDQRDRDKRPWAGGGKRVYPGQGDAAMIVHICLLGTLEVYREGSKLALPPGTRLRTLLAWLALYPGPHPRARLAARFWPDVPDSSARASLRSAVWTLRVTLGPASACLAADRAWVGLRDGCVRVDLHEFSELAAAGRLHEAVALCRGELLHELDDDWVYEEREAHAERLAGVLGQIAAQAGAAGDTRTATAWARRRAALRPLDEQAAQDLIHWLARAGDAPGALVAYGRLRARLRDELGVPPSPQTRQLVSLVRAGQAGRARRTGGPPD